MKIRKQPKPDFEPSPRSAGCGGKPLSQAVSRHAPACRLFCAPLGADTGNSKNRALERVGRSTKAQGGAAYPCYLKTKAKVQIFSGFF